MTLKKGLKDVVKGFTKNHATQDTSTDAKCHGACTSHAAAAATATTVASVITAVVATVIVVVVVVRRATHVVPGGSVNHRWWGSVHDWCRGHHNRWRSNDVGRWWRRSILVGVDLLLLLRDLLLLLADLSLLLLKLPLLLLLLLLLGIVWLRGVLLRWVLLRGILLRRILLVLLRSGVAFIKQHGTIN